MDPPSPGGLTRLRILEVDLHPRGDRLPQRVQPLLSLLTSLERQTPGGGVDDRATGRSRDALAERLGEGHEDLAQRGAEGRLHARQARRGRTGDEEERLRLLDGEPGEVEPVP